MCKNEIIIPLLRRIGAIFQTMDFNYTNKDLGMKSMKAERFPTWTSAVPKKIERKKYRTRINRKTGHVASFIQPLERGFSGFLDFLLTHVYPLLNLKHELQIQHATRKEDSILDGIIMAYHKENGSVTIES